MPVTVIVHSGKSILYIDYRGLKKKEEMLANLHEAVKIYRSHPTEKYRVLIDVTDAAGSQEWMDESKKYGKEMGKQTIKSAILGVTGVKKVLLMGYNAVVGGRLKPFSTKDAALEYLVED